MSWIFKFNFTSSWVIQTKCFVSDVSCEAAASHLSSKTDQRNVITTIWNKRKQWKTVTINRVFVCLSVCLFVYCCVCRNYSVVNLKKGAVEVKRMSCPGSKISCQMKMGNTLWMATEVHSSQQHLTSYLPSSHNKQNTVLVKFTVHVRWPDVSPVCDCFIFQSQLESH